MMEMLDLLGEENNHVKSAIKKILETDHPNIGVYDTTQGFVCLKRKKEK